MKKLAIAITLLIIGIVIYRITTYVPSRFNNPYDRGNARATCQYLTRHTSYGKISIEEWKQKSPAVQLLIISGIQVGASTGMIIVGPKTPPQVRTQHIDLLQGWKRPAGDFAKEIDRLMQQEDKEISLFEALVEAQATFCSQDDQLDRNEALIEAEEWIPAFITYSHIENQARESRGLWETIKALHMEKEYTASLLDGIALTNAAMHQGCLVPGLAQDPNELTAEMRKEAPNLKPTDKLIYLFEYTAAKLPTRPGK